MGPCSLPMFAVTPLIENSLNPLAINKQEDIRSRRLRCLAVSDLIMIHSEMNVTNIGAGFMTALHKFHSGTRERF